VPVLISLALVSCFRKPKEERIGGSLTVNGPMTVKGPFRVESSAVIHGPVRAKQLYVGGPVSTVLPRDERPGNAGQDFASALTAGYGARAAARRARNRAAVLKREAQASKPQTESCFLGVGGSLVVNGPLTVDGPLRIGGSLTTEAGQTLKVEAN